MLSQFGIEASRPALYVLAFAIILVLVALFGLVLRKLTGGRLMTSGQDRSRTRQPRLGVVDIYELDGKRKLVLLRRDNVEHLLLIGGLNDVVIETNIVRVAGARIPAANLEQGVERFEPAFEPTRPQVETPGRPSIETQLAAQLGSFMKRSPNDNSPNDNSDDELSRPEVEPPGEPIRSEPVRKPEVAFPITPAVEPVRSEPVAPAFSALPENLRPAAEAPPVRVEPRSYMPPIFQSRPTPAPPAPPPPAPPPPIPPAIPGGPVRPAESIPGERGAPDAAILSDMAKQLEEALKRPAMPLPENDDRGEPASAAIEDNPDLDEQDLEDDLLEPTVEQDEIKVTVTEEVVTIGPATEHAHPGAAPAEPDEKAVPEVAASAASPKPPEKSLDPFSVEEIEAEFARLLGRPLDAGKKG